MSESQQRPTAEATRRRILEAARNHFAERGYDRATIRGIAADASIDPSMVMRYFGSKEGLFAAAAQVPLRLPDLAEVSRDRLGARLVRHFVERWEGDATLVAMLRRAVNDERTAEQMREIFASQLKPVVGRVAGGPEEAATRAGLVATQMLGLALCRYVLRFPPVVALGTGEIVEWYGPTVQRYLTD
jgi:AcrR family transcriptional regulator